MREIIRVILLCYLLAASVRDIRTRKVSAKAALAVALPTAVWHLFAQGKNFAWAAGLLPGIVLIAISGISRQAIGLGDGWVVAVIGLCLGFHGAADILMMALFLSFPVALYYLVCKKAGRKKALPFVPCLCAGYVLWLALCG